MSKVRKFDKRKATIADVVSDVYSEFGCLRDEMSEWRDGLEEKFSQTSKYDSVSQAADDLDNIADSEPEVPEALKTVEIEWTEVLPRDKRRGLSRADRCSNAVNALDAILAHVEEMLDDKEDETLEQFRDELDEHKSNAESVEFPGMFG